MRSTFPGFYLPSNEQFRELWKTCVFVLDASVLLNLYRYPVQARDDLLRVLHNVESRLWMPYQAALEYQQNRLSVIAEQKKKFDDVRAILNKAEESLVHGLDQLQLAKRHSLIKADDFVRGIGKRIKNFQNRLNQLEAEQTDVFSPDDLREEIDSLLDGKIGSSPASQEELDALYEEAVSRYQNEQPPGYLDAHKEEECYVYDGLCFKRKYGDLILWNQVIEHIKKESIKGVILLTDDRKEDWWWIVRSQGDKTIGPRPELVQEIKTRTNISLFYMYNSERFIEYAERYLGVSVEQKSIEQVRDFRRIYDLAKRTRESGLVKAEKWLTNLLPPASLRTQLLAVAASRFSSITELPTNAKIAVSASQESQEWLRRALAYYRVELIIVYIPAVEIPLALERHVIEAALIELHPSPAMTHFINLGRIRLLSWSDDAIVSVLAAYPSILGRTYLPANTYAGQNDALLGYAPRTANE